MGAVKQYRRPDHDPLQVTPHEKFEAATLQQGHIAPYEVVIKRMAKPVIVQAHAGDVWSVREVIWRLAWAYRRKPQTVEEDLYREGERQLQAAVAQAFRDGLVLVDGARP